MYVVFNENSTSTSATNEEVDACMEGARTEEMGEAN